MRVSEQTDEIGQTSKGIFRSLHISISFGCLSIENLYSQPQTESDTRTEKNEKGGSSPVTDALGSQQDGVIQVIICGGTITESLSSMEDKRDIETQLLLTIHEVEEWDEVVYDRFRRIFWAD